MRPYVFFFLFASQVPMFFMSYPVCSGCWDSETPTGLAEHPSPFPLCLLGPGKARREGQTRIASFPIGRKSLMY